VEEHSQGCQEQLAGRLRHFAGKKEKVTFKRGFEKQFAEHF